MDNLKLGIYCVVGNRIGDLYRHAREILLFNHWRTAENRTSIRYAAEATLMGGRHREEFYRDYASHLCVKDAEAFLVLVQGEAILSGCGYGDTSLIAVVDCTVEVVGHTLPADHITLMGIQVVVWL